MESQAVGPSLFITRNARLRLHQRFPGREQEVVRRCRRFYRDICDFLGSAVIRYRTDNLVAVIAHDRLVTVYPVKQKRHRRYPRLTKKRLRGSLIDWSLPQQAQPVGQQLNHPSQQRGFSS
ncbi:MAG: hypothetical protein ABW148_16830 [Sedimenticola sp.]